MPTWIVVEDEPDLHKVVLIMYQMMGVKAAGFLSGEEMVDWIGQVDDGHYSGDLPQLALIDIRLPGKVSGIDVGARLRRSPALHDIAIVLMTAYHLSPQQEDLTLREAGADMLFYKPLPRPDKFKPMLEDILNRSFPAHG